MMHKLQDSHVRLARGEGATPLHLERVSNATPSNKNTTDVEVRTLLTHQLMFCLLYLVMKSQMTTTPVV